MATLENDIKVAEERIREMENRRIILQEDGRERNRYDSRSKTGNYRGIGVIFLPT